MPDTELRALCTSFNLHNSMRQALKDLLAQTPQKDVLSIIEDKNAKVASQEIPGITSKFGLGVQNEAGKG